MAPPSYLSTLPVAENSDRHYLRSAVRVDLVVPVTKTVRYGPRSFAVRTVYIEFSVGIATQLPSLPSSFRRDS